MSSRGREGGLRPRWNGCLFNTLLRFGCIGKDRLVVSLQGDFTGAVRVVGDFDHFPIARTREVRPSRPRDTVTGHQRAGVGRGHHPPLLRELE